MKAAALSYDLSQIIQPLSPEVAERYRSATRTGLAQRKERLRNRSFGLGERLQACAAPCVHLRGSACPRKFLQDFGKTVCKFTETL
ncbi:hypothetical protein [Sphingomonas sp. PP-CC-3G-468]|uniref:hypothetical protein n=1 Tax=Sphingomonas sp. PP-CC-3G-468 TaxID=2135656 RepID=UPI0010CF7939|nr:hypothetical protein [Sphingomonas sp. PP-CC-3G-468]TCM07360.1 hypothetical protein C8J41_103268 [Sphingomonas sp. PP-CC-3G-468]